MENAGLLEDAEPYLWQAIELRPDKLETGQHWSAIRQRLCKWPILTPSEHFSLRQLIDALSPLALGSYADDPIFQLAKAYRYNKSLVGRPIRAGIRARVLPANRARGHGCASAMSRRICATTPSALRCARCWNCTTRTGSKSTPITAAILLRTIRRRTA